MTRTVIIEGEAVKRKVGEFLEQFAHSAQYGCLRGRAVRAVPQTNLRHQRLVLMQARLDQFLI